MPTHDPRHPGRPGVCAYARIDEAKVNATGQGSGWLAQTTHWFHRAGMLTAVGECITGGTVYLHAHSIERARELVAEAVRHGVPANCAKAVTQVDMPKVSATVTAEQLSIDNDLDRDDEHPEPPAPGRPSQAEMRDLRRQGARIVDLYTANTIPTGSYL